MADKETTLKHYLEQHKALQEELRLLRMDAKQVKATYGWPVLEGKK